MLSFEELEREARQANDMLANIRERIIDNGIIVEGLHVYLSGEIAGEIWQDCGVCTLEISGQYSLYGDRGGLLRASSIENALKSLLQNKGGDFQWSKFVWVNASLVLNNVHLGEISIYPYQYPDLFVDEEMEEELYTD